MRRAICIIAIIIIMIIIMIIYVYIVRLWKNFLIKKDITTIVLFVTV